VEVRTNTFRSRQNHQGNGRSGGNRADDQEDVGIIPLGIRSVTAANTLASPTVIADIYNISVAIPVDAPKGLNGI